MKLKQILISVVIYLLSIVSLQAQYSEQTENYYKKIQGLYQDTKTNEIVFILLGFGRFDLFYQPNPYCLNTQVKVMKQLSLDVAKNQMQIEFAKSNYRCTFLFARDHQSFICKNPDGSQQTFKRTKQVIHKPFAYFLSLFPKHTTNRYYVPPRPAYKQELPVQIAWKFLTAKQFNDDIFPAKDLDIYGEYYLYRLFLGTPHAKGSYYGANTCYVVKQLSLSPNFYSLLVREKGVIKGGEGSYDTTFLYNFSKKGELLGYLLVGGAQIGMGHFEWHTSSTIQGTQIKVLVKDYNGRYAKNKSYKTRVEHYTLLPSGKFK
ncbi:hypothetical protein BKI52_04475 [marine bacterium AO1-C]|nr:hypothetical protein BKI52_04475 [marine bacterium AO1-C]